MDYVNVVKYIFVQYLKTVQKQSKVQTMIKIILPLIEYFKKGQIIFKNLAIFLNYFGLTLLKNLVVLKERKETQNVFWDVFDKYYFY